MGQRQRHNDGAEGQGAGSKQSTKIQPKHDACAEHLQPWCCCLLTAKSTLVAGTGCTVKQKNESHLLGHVLGLRLALLQLAARCSASAVVVMLRRNSAGDLAGAAQRTHLSSSTSTSSCTNASKDSGSVNMVSMTVRRPQGLDASSCALHVSSCAQSPGASMTVPHFQMLQQYSG